MERYPKVISKITTSFFHVLQRVLDTPQTQQGKKKMIKECDCCGKEIDAVANQKYCSACGSFLNYILHQLSHYKCKVKKLQKIYYDSPDNKQRRKLLGVGG